MCTQVCVHTRAYASDSFPAHHKDIMEDVEFQSQQKRHIAESIIPSIAWKPQRSCTEIYAGRGRDHMNGQSCWANKGKGKEQESDEPLRKYFYFLNFCTKSDAMSPDTFWSVSMINTEGNRIWFWLQMNEFEYRDRVEWEGTFQRQPHIFPLLTWIQLYIIWFNTSRERDRERHTCNSLAWIERNYFLDFWSVSLLF